MIDIDMLRALAAASTPGPWRWWETASGAKIAGRPADKSRNFVCDVLVPENAVQGADNAAYIAACDPATITALCDEVAALRAENAKHLRAALMHSDVISTHCIAMQSAVIAAELESPADGMQWIENTLYGPGLSPDIEEARKIGGAQAWFDREMAAEATRKAAIAATKPSEQAGEESKR